MGGYCLLLLITSIGYEIHKVVTGSIHNFVAQFFFKGKVGHNAIVNDQSYQYS